MIKNSRAFIVNFISPTNTKGSRVKILDPRNKKSIIISYDYEFNNIYDIALNHLKEIGIKCFGLCDYGNKGYILLTNDFITNLIVNSNNEN